MSREARRWVWEQAPVDDARQMLILLSLADVADEFGGNAYPSKSRLARDSRSNPRTVQRHLGAMVGSGLISVEQEAAGHRPTTYAFPALRGDSVSPHDSARGDTGETNDDFAPLVGIGSKDVEADAPTSESLLLCKLLADRYAQFAGLPPANYQTRSWTNAMRLLLERGPTGRPSEPLSVDTIRRRINGIFDHLADPGSSGFCWAAQIRSPLGLRKHWDQITVVSKTLRSTESGTITTQEVPYDPDRFEAMG